jgi:hypothetical protein
MPCRDVDYLGGIRVKRSYRSHPAIPFRSKHVASPGDSEHPRQNAFPLTLAPTGFRANREKLPTGSTHNFDEKRRPANER